MGKLVFLVALGVCASACADDTTNNDPQGGGGSTASNGGSAGTTTPTTGGNGAGAGGSASTSSSMGGGQPTGCASYLFCEDFETGAPGEIPTDWTEHSGWDQGGSRAVLSTEEKHGGAQSLKSAVGTNGQYRIEHTLDSALATNHWGRIFYKVKTPVALDGQYIHNTFVAFGRPDSENGGESRLVDTVMSPEGMHQFLFNVPDDSCCAGSSYDFAYDAAWHCAEWHVDGATESFQFFYDGTEVDDIAFMNVDGAHIADFSSIIVGWINYQSPSTPNEGWFDDLALDDERIGCD